MSSQKDPHFQIPIEKSLTYHLEPELAPYLKCTESKHLPTLAASKKAIRRAKSRRRRLEKTPRARRKASLVRDADLPEGHESSRLQLESVCGSD